MKTKKIVIISAVFYPRNSPRANRATELAKEFARQGHDIVVYTVLGKYDYSEFIKLHNLEIKNLGKMNFVTLNSDGQSKNTIISVLLSKLFHKVLEFPDIEYSGKVSRVLKDEKDIDLLITIAVPFPIHWGAALAKKHFIKNNIKTWVADCGDPYMGNNFMKRPFYFKYVEKWFCKKADYLTIPIEQAKKGYYNEFQNKIKVIPQGFCLDNMAVLDKHTKNSKPTFVYAGAFYKDIRDPRPFLDYLCNLDIEFKFIIYTKNKSLIEHYKSKLGINLEIHDYIPREELLKVMSQADFLINFENGTEFQSPSKLIDYALSKRPILSIPSLQINQNEILEFLNGNYSNQLIVSDIHQFDIKNIANKFLELCESKY